MNHDPHTLPPDEVALDRALAAALPPPGLPAGFHARLIAAIQAPADEALAGQRRQLEAEHRREMAALRSGFVRLRRETLAMVLAVAFTAGAVAHWAVPWLQARWGLDLSSLLPALAGLIGLATGAAVWVERFGWPRLPLWRR